MKSQTIAFIDSNYLCYKAVHTTGRLSFKNEGTGVIYGFLQQVLEVSKKIRPQEIVFCWDSKKSKRRKEYPFYKTKEKKEDPEFWEMQYHQFHVLRTQVLPDLGFANNFILTGYESDDLIASLANDPDNHVVVTADEDLYQLLGRCVIYNPGKKEWITKQTFKEAYGINPEQWIEVKKIGGCTSDTIPGIENVGEKRAISYLKGELKETTEAYKKIISPAGQAIIERNDWLVRLPLPGTRKFKIQKSKFNLNRFARMCRHYGFYSFIKRNMIDEWEIYFG